MTLADLSPPAALRPLGVLPPAARPPELPERVPSPGSATAAAASGVPDPSRASWRAP